MEDGRGIIALHGIRQKKENFRKPRRGFRFWCRLLAVLIFLLTAVQPLSGLTAFPSHDKGEQSVGRTSWSSDGNTLLAEPFGAGGFAEKSALLTAPAMLQMQQALMCGSDSLGYTGFLRQRVAFRYRYLQQIRLFVCCMVTGFLLLTVQVFVHCGVIRRRQKELVWRRLWMIRYRNCADGKKEGIPFSIKRKHNFYEREDIKMDIIIWIMVIVGGAAGALSTVYLVLAMPVILAWKIYRKVKYNIALRD